jgi:hypothetical protein
MTQWSPDTCGCVVEYDDQINVVAVHKKCTKHAATPDDATHLATMLAHNRKKNAILNAIVAHVESTGAKAPKIAVTYDDNDDLRVVGESLSAADQAAALAVVGPLLGTSKLNWS